MSKKRMKYLKLSSKAKWLHLIWIMMQDLMIEGEMLNNRIGNKIRM
jgi:hypothetical protein